MFKYLAKKLYPYLEPLIDEKVQGVMYRATDAQLATDTLAEKLGYTIVIDFETGIASVHGVGK